jgi:hypothetical protein
VQNDLTRMTLDALGECVFGYEFNTIEAGDNIISRAFTDILTGVNGSINTVTRKLISKFPFLKYFIKSVRKRKESFEIIFQAVKQVSLNGEYSLKCLLFY